MKGRKRGQELPIKELPIPSRESAVQRTRRIENRRTGEGLSESQGKVRLLEVIERSGVEETAIRLAQENAVMAEIGRIISSTLNRLSCQCCIGSSCTIIDFIFHHVF